MTAIKLEDVPNYDQPLVKDLINKFKSRNEMNIIDVSEVISKLITTLSVDHDSGRPKLYTISQGHLGEILGIGKGVVSQYMSVWNMPEETKRFLKQYNLSLINAYHVSRTKGKDETETIKLQKQIIVDKSTAPISVSGKRTDILVHTINETEMILSGIIISYKIPKELLKNTTEDNLTNKAKLYIENINIAINYLCPKLANLQYLQEEIKFCNSMIQHNVTKFCGQNITMECLNKQIESISSEINLIETEQKLPHISSLLMMRENLEKNI
jgi:hypothetical protein